MSFVVTMRLRLRNQEVAYMTSSTDRIDREILLNAPLTKVWNALANAEEFGDRFKIDFTGKTFKPGQKISGHITYAGYEHLVAELQIDKIEPQHYLSLHWHPYAVDPDVDYSQEPTTLVEFVLKEVNDGILVTVSESGFDLIPLARRDEAFRMNSGGWEEQMKNIERYVAGT